MTTAIIPTKQIAVAISEDTWAEASLLPCQISVDLPLKKFTVRDLLRLDIGAILETANEDSEDVPLMVNAQLIGWVEFEIVGRRIAVRITEVG
jgi:flagellar motor switch/type III secretory pathway protein FliN